MTILLWSLAVLLVVIGLAGILVPVLPGAVLVFVGLVLAAWADEFAHVGWFTLAILAILTIGVYLLDFLAGAYGTDRMGASKRAVVGAVLGGVVGLFFGLPGLILGPFIGAVAGEYTVRRNLGQAGRAGAGAWLGLALGAAVKVALVFVMLGIFAAAFLF